MTGTQKPEENNKNYYADNLAEVNRDNAVVASEDIVNDKGVLIVPKGARLDPETARKVTRHKLAVPLEMRVTLSQGCNIYEDFKGMPKHPEVVNFFSNPLTTKKFAEESEKVRRYPLITQKLAVMSSQFPMLYLKAVMGAAVALMICQERELDDDATHIVFVAALARDLGLLHIDPAVVGKEGSITAEEWRLLQGHVAIGYHFLTFVPKLPKMISRAVLEHHERTDGFGYPKGKLDSQLCDAGQIVAFADQVIAIFFKYVAKHGYSLRALEPIIQINVSVNREVNAKAALRLINRIVAPMTTCHKTEEIPMLISNIIDRRVNLKHLFEIICSINEVLAEEFNHPDLSRTAEMVEQLSDLFVTSGINDDLFVNWLVSLEPTDCQDEEILDIEQYALMLNEVSWHLNQLTKLVRGVVANLDAAKLDEHDIEQKVNILEQLLNKSSNEVL
ncbi:HD-GYP domain-containing protein [Flocculibacter collagenilyticus]|uniref:HD-GYP domain-containing protein n=1 Tax=Flocculibacter collagenilyticus TaxID=2744479 RepID=UPI0018F40367|nr:HD domain-containing phosphohydrolase [Flocculibacter collagenilyticus]